VSCDLELQHQSLTDPREIRRRCTTAVVCSR
jgi:hypothetical protein